METFDEMIARREREAREFEARYANDPEKLDADLNKAIQALEKSGYIVRAYDNQAAYEIMHSDCSTVYGYGTCSAEQVMRFAAETCEAEVLNAEPVELAPLYGADQAKEREYDQVYNEGGEGYNPYRIGSAHTYKKICWPIGDTGRMEQKMDKNTRKRVLNGEIVDTKKYRYALKVCGDHEKQWAEIRRIPLECLDTTAATDGWETVEVLYEA